MLYPSDYSIEPEVFKNYVAKANWEFGQKFGIEPEKYLLRCADSVKFMEWVGKKLSYIDMHSYRLITN